VHVSVAFSPTELEFGQGFSVFLEQKCIRRLLFPKSILSFQQRKCVTLASYFPKYLQGQGTAAKEHYPQIIFTKTIFKNYHLPAMLLWGDLSISGTQFVFQKLGKH